MESIEKFSAFLKSCLDLKKDTVLMVKLHREIISYIEYIAYTYMQDAKYVHFQTRLSSILDSIVVDSVSNLKFHIRNLIYFLLYFDSENKFKECFSKIQKSNYAANDYQKHQVGLLFLHYLDSSIIDTRFVQTVLKIDEAFTPEIENHLIKGVELVPCISLFKKYDEIGDHSNEVSTSPYSWLLLAIKLIFQDNLDQRKATYQMFLKFLRVYDLKCNSCNRTDFFCTILIPLMDSLNLINCLEKDYNIIGTVLYTIVSVIGKPDILLSLLQKEKHRSTCFMHILSQPFLNLNSIHLISLKSTKQSIEKFESLGVNQEIVKLSPMIYRYEPVSQVGKNGILTQLFLFAARKLNVLPKYDDILIIEQSCLLNRLPFEWKNLLHIHELNCENIKKEEEENNIQEEKDPDYFYISSHDVYTALYYIFRVMRYYMKCSYFESETELFDIYHRILRTTILKFPKCNEKDMVQHVMQALNKSLGSPIAYTLPTKEIKEFNFFSNGESKRKNIEISYYKISQENPNVGQCDGKYILGYNKEDDNSAIHVILYLSTILQIRSIKLFMFALDYKNIVTPTKFPDRSFYRSLLYRLGPGTKIHSILHHVIHNYSKLPISCFGLGILRMFSILKNPKDPIQILPQLITKIYSKCNIEHDIDLCTLLVNLFLKFKSYEIQKWFYPSIIGTAFAYHDENFFQYIKNNIKNTFCCEASFLEIAKIDKIHENIAIKIKIIEEDKDKKIIHKLFKDSLNYSHKNNFQWCDLFYFIIHLCNPFLYPVNSFECSIETPIFIFDSALF